MIITCASCLTKFNLDDSRIPPKGVKVRCSRCKHVFYVVPPPETQEEIIEDVESFAKYHEDLIEPGQKEAKAPLPEKTEKEEKVSEEEETSLFSEKAPLPRKEEVVPVEPIKKERVEAEPPKPKAARRSRKGLSLIYGVIVVLVLLIFGAFYLWKELGSGGKFAPYLESPVKKITDLWNQIWGTEKEDLIVGNLNGYEEKIGEISLFIIEGKVNNQSSSTKKYIKIKVDIFDREKSKVAEKEAICGYTINRGELKNLPDDFFKGEMVVKPQTESEMIVPPGKEAPFMVIFKDLSSQAKEFKVEIIEAPNR